LRPAYYSLYSSNKFNSKAFWEEIDMKFVKTIFAVFALTLLGATLAPGARADEWNKKTVMTFSQPVEIPGQILPAGTYTFVLLDSPSDRHIVQIFDADGSKIITTVLAINNYRLKPTGDTVVKFAERSGDNPEALKGWFYPGDNFGQEFVYPKQRAIELALLAKEPVPALAADNTDLKAAPIVAETPDQKEEPVAEAIQVTPPAAEVATPTPVVQETAPAPVAATTPAPVVDTTPAPVAETQQLPQTASQLPLIALLGVVALGAALLLKRFSS
jgi:LPXTG-motif cell wall-anchored protein